MNWWNTIDPYLVEVRFAPLKSDTCVYIYTTKEGLTIILTLYVDDLLLRGHRAARDAPAKADEQIQDNGHGKRVTRPRHASYPRPREGILTIS